MFRQAGKGRASPCSMLPKNCGNSLTTAIYPQLEGAFLRPVKLHTKGYSSELPVYAYVAWCVL
jgi:hypothetical protein